MSFPNPPNVRCCPSSFVCSKWLLRGRLRAGSGLHRNGISFKTKFTRLNFDKGKHVFNLGFGEILVIAFIFIIVVGPDRLPELLRSLGKALRSVQKANQELQSTIGIDKLRQELLFPHDLQDSLKWRPKPTYHSPLQPPESPEISGSSAHLDSASAAPSVDSPPDVNQSSANGQPSPAASPDRVPTDEDKSGGSS